MGFLKKNEVKFENSGVYKIIIQGRLEASWSSRLAGMQISAGRQPGGSDATTLMGHLRDQAQLSGVLNSLYELHLPILSVTRLEDEPNDG